jgi:molybdopterin-guanine dinucleotide biosynthesis protein A
VVSEPGVTGIVLAGGRATRFGADKLAALLDGRPLLHHAILAVASVADEVVVVIGADGARPRLPVDAATGIRVARDSVADGGPLAGLAAGLAAAHGRVAIVAGGDQPWLSPAILSELLLWLDSAVDGPALDAVALVQDEQVRPLPVALRVGTVRPVAEALLSAGTRSLVGLLAHLRVGTLQPERWRTLDRDGASLRDVDTPDALAGP